MSDIRGENNTSDPPSSTDVPRRSTEVYSDNSQNRPTAFPRETGTAIAAGEKPTPIPWLQLSLILLIQLAEPIVSKVIFPFVNQFVRSTGITGGDATKTGYFSGPCNLPFYP